MTSQVLISQIHCTLSTNQKRDSEIVSSMYNNYNNHVEAVKVMCNHDMYDWGNHVQFACFVLRAISEEVLPCHGHFLFRSMFNKTILLDSVFCDI